MNASSSSIRDLLETLEQSHCSDLFLTVGKPPAVRRHGAIESLDLPVTAEEDLEKFLSQALTTTQRKRLETIGDLDAGYSLTERRRFRLNLSKQMGQIQLVARALPSGNLSFDELNLPGAVAKLAKKPRGLVLVTGATGSGKSTTLAAMINAINAQRAAHIVSI